MRGLSTAGRIIQSTAILVLVAATGLGAAGSGDLDLERPVPRPTQVGVEVSELVETEHPYWGPRNGELQLIWSVEIHDPDASYICPHFSRFELAAGDLVVVRSPKGTRSWTYSGTGKGTLGLSEGFWAVHIPGDTAVVELFSRNQMGAYGVTIDRHARGFRPDEAAAERGMNKEICGTDDSEWAMCYESSEATIYTKSMAVARLLINGTTLCTGWLLGSEGHLLTNNHCIGDASDAANTDFEFMAEGATCATDCAWSGACSGTVEANSSTLIQTDSAEDYSLVLLDWTTNPAATYGYLQFDSVLPEKDDRIYIPQHPQGWGKRIAVLSTDTTNDESGYAELSVQLYNPLTDVLSWTYYADTQGGSSGSPVVTYADHLVVALHRGADGCSEYGNLGTQAVTLLSDLRDVLPDDAATFTVSVTIDGTGTGTVSSSPSGIDCAGDCSEDYSCNTAVTLTPSAGANSVFSGWSGDDADCDDGILTVNAHLSCTATFNLETRTLTVSTTGDGTGTVTSSPSGVDCPGDCSEGYEHGQVVDLTATPDAGSLFAGWSGDADCSDGQVTMDADVSCTATFQLPRTFYVDIDASGDETGASWTHAFTDLHAALAEVIAGDEIWVAEGVYYPDAGSGQTPDDTASTFELVNGVAIYGGFDGTESLLSQRDADTHLTILSGDIDGNDDDADGDSIADTWNDIVGSNAYHVVTASGTDATTVLDGLVITAGHASGASDPDDTGAAILCDGGGSPTLDNLTVIGNHTADRAALAGCESTVTSSRFESNYADMLGAVSNEGGTYIDSVFIGNRSVSQSPVFYVYGSTLTLTNCVVMDSQANNAGAVRVFNGTVDFDNVLFSGNKGKDGAAIYLNGSTGGTLTNVTVTGNNATRYGAVYMGASGSLTVENSILWDNQDLSGSCTLDSALYDAGNGSVTVSSSILQASGGSASWSAGSIADGGDNLDQDPLFVDPLDPSNAPSTSGDLHLWAGSPALDAGDDSKVLTSTDLDGEDRIQDGTVDLGAYEGPEPIADLQVTVTDGVTSAAPGSDITYAIVASNDGPSDDGAASLTDTFPTDLSCAWTSVATGGASGNTSGSGDLDESLSLPASSSVTYTVVCAIDPSATGTLSNTAAIAASLTDSDSGNNSASDADTVLTPSADLSVSISDGLTQAVAGETLTYTIVAANDGPSDASSVSLTDTFPSDLSCSWTSLATGGASGNTSGSGDLAEALSLPASSSVTYTAVCAIGLVATGTLSNTATIAGSATDPDTTNNSASDTDTAVLSQADLSVSVSDGVTQVQVGETLTYTIVAANDGPSDAGSVSLTDTFPSQLSCGWTSLASGGASGNTSGSGDLAETLSLPSGSTVTYTVTCTVDEVGTGALSNTAEVSSAGVSDPDSTNDSATDDDTSIMLFGDDFESGDTLAWQ